MGRLEVLIFSGCLVITASGGAAASQDIAAGKALAQKYCAKCHAIGSDGVSPLPAAPAFRVIAERYSVWNLEEALAEGIVTGHTAMPQFAFKPAEITNLLTYMDTLAKKKPLSETSKSRRPDAR